MNSQILYRSRYVSEQEQIQLRHETSIQVFNGATYTSTNQQTKRRDSSPLSSKYAVCLGQLRKVLDTNQSLKSQLIVCQQHLKNSNIQKTNLQNMMEKIKTVIRDTQMNSEHLSWENRYLGKYTQQHAKPNQQIQEEILNMKYNYERQLQYLLAAIDQLKNQLAHRDQQLLQYSNQFKKLNVKQIENKLKEYKLEMLRQKQAYQHKLQIQIQKVKSQFETERQKLLIKSHVTQQGIYRKFFIPEIETLKQHTNRRQTNRRIDMSVSNSKPLNNYLKSDSEYYYLDQKYKILIKEKNLNDFKLKTYENVIKKLENQIQIMEKQCRCKKDKQYAGEIQSRIRKYQDELMKASKEINRLNQALIKQSNVASKVHELEQKLEDYEDARYNMLKTMTQRKQQMLLMSKANESCRKQINDNRQLLDSKNHQISQLKFLLYKGQQPHIMKATIIDDSSKQYQINNGEFIKYKEAAEQKITMLQEKITMLEEKIDQYSDMFDGQMGQSRYDSQRDLLYIRRSDSKTNFLLKIEALSTQNKELQQYKNHFVELKSKHARLLKQHQQLQTKIRILEHQSKKALDRQIKHRQKEGVYLEMITKMEKTIKQLSELDKHNQDFGKDDKISNTRNCRFVDVYQNFSEEQIKEEDTRTKLIKEMKRDEDIKKLQEDDLEMSAKMRYLEERFKSQPWNQLHSSM